MGLKVMHKHRINAQKKFKPRGNCKSAPDRWLRSDCEKRGVWMRLKHDVWSGEISFSRTQRAEKRIGWREDRVGGWGGRILKRNTSSYSGQFPCLLIVGTVLKRFFLNVSTEYSKMFVVSFAEATASTFCLQSVLSNTGLRAKIEWDLVWVRHRTFIKPLFMP